MQKLKDINLAIASGSENIQKCLQEMFRRHGANVVLCGFLNLSFVDQLEHAVDADVILIDMDDSYAEDDDALDQLLEKIDLPILFHDNEFDELHDPQEESFSIQSVEKLAAKLSELVTSKKNKDRKNAEQSISDEQLKNANTIDKLLESEHKRYPYLTEEELQEVRLWDLYSSDSKTTESLADEQLIVIEELIANEEPSAGKEP
ncbi:MAG: hypothetical protein KAI22_06345, partial [Gammaproteobacteria bacterium]|nr:hypothetical protein [Gammaproteobacteria bacterium]